MQDQLTRIHERVAADPRNVPTDVKKEFWRLVGQIKRIPNPEEDVIAKASEVRNLLYQARLGRAFPTKLVVPVWCLLGLVGPGLDYFWALAQPATIGILLARFICVGGVVAFFYPLGRLIAGRLMGVHFDGVARDPYWEPTMKINYPSYLRAPAPKRKWFFFLAGLVTPITGFVTGCIGFWLASDMIGFLVAGILGLYAVLALRGIAKLGEMAHFRRERKIERDWKRNKEQLTEA